MSKRLRGRDAIIAAAQARGRPVPDFGDPERPHVHPHIELYHRCFMDCSTCRAIGMGVGPIPWESVMQWASLNGMESDDADAMWRVITIADSEYLERANEKAQTDAKRNHPQSRR